MNKAMDDIHAEAKAVLSAKLVERMRLFATSSKPPHSGEHFLAVAQLFCKSNTHGSALGIIRHKKRVIAKTVNFPDDSRLLKFFRYVEDETSHDYDQGAFNIVSLSDKSELVMLGEPDASFTPIVQQLSENLIFKRKRYAFYFFLVAMLVLGVIMFYPFKERVTTNGTVLGAPAHSVSSGIEGHIEEITHQYGYVTRGSTIAIIRNDIALRVDQAELELRELIINYENAALSNLEDAELIESNIRSKRKQIELLRNQAQHNQITASSDGYIQWQDNIIGRLIKRGEDIAIIQPSNQNVISATIPVKDWISINKESTVTFIQDGSFNKYLLELDHGRPHLISSIDGVPSYQLKTYLDQDLPTGTTGILTIKGNYTTLWNWLFGNTLRWWASNVSLPSLKAQ